jgi:hypothetical protein
VSKLAVAVVAIALADCINPSLIGGELFVATGPHPRQKTIAFTVAAWIVTFVVGLALALGLGDLSLALVPKPGRTVKYELVTAAGVALIIGAAVSGSAAGRWWGPRRAMFGTRRTSRRR